jgi:hypothetical protein
MVKVLVATMVDAVFLRTSSPLLAGCLPGQPFQPNPFFGGRFSINQSFSFDSFLMAYHGAIQCWNMP